MLNAYSNLELYHGIEKTHISVETILQEDLSGGKDGEYK